MTRPLRRLREPALEALRPEDAEGCRRLSGLAGWPHTAEDWRIRLEVGTGLGVRDAQGRLVAVGAALRGGPGIGFIGLVLTDPERRGEGLGGAITAGLAAVLRAEGRTPCLFAVPKAVPLYERLGFTDRGRLDSYRGTLRSILPCAAREGDHAEHGGGGVTPRMVEAPPPPRFVRSPSPADAGEELAVRPLTAADLDEVLALDRRSYGGDRAALIADQFARDPDLALVAEAEGAVQGYALGARKPALSAIGPVAARTADIALRMLRVLAGRIGPAPARCDTLAREGAHPFAEALAGLGLGPPLPCRLMTQGALAGPVFPAPDQLFAAQSAFAG